MEHFGPFEWKQIEGLPVGMGPPASQQNWGGGVPGACPSLALTGCVRGGETAPLHLTGVETETVLGEPQTQKVAMSCKGSNWATLIA